MNTEVSNNDVIDLGPLPQMIRAPSYDEYEEEPLIFGGSFEDFQNNQYDFVMPEPCVNCYTFNCNEMCCQEMELIPRQLSFEEVMELPPPPALTRIHTSAYLPDDFDFPEGTQYISLTIINEDEEKEQK